MYEARSPLTYADVSALPVMIAIAEFENPLLDLYGLGTRAPHRRCPPLGTPLCAPRRA